MGHEKIVFVGDKTLMSKKDLIILPKISGSTIKNEKRADFSRSIPNKTAIAIVEPLLEIPGKIATA